MPTLTEEILLMLHEGLYFLLDPHPHFPISSGYRPASYYKAIDRMEKKGLLKKQRKERKTHLSLTNKGKRLVQKHRKEGRRSTGLWDRKWRLVIFDIPEKIAAGRNYLRYYLKDLGFGKVQRSIWISPHDFQKQIDRFALKMKISDYLFQLTVDRFHGKTDKELVQAVWPIHEINHEYRDLVEKYSGQVNRLQRERKKKTYHTVHAQKRFLLNLKWDYQSILSRDPQLPPDLLPSDWARKSALGLIRKAENMVRAIPT